MNVGVVCEIFRVSADIFVCEKTGSPFTARLLLNPDLFRDGMLNPDLASPG
jgi:hypothetical protein